MPGWTEQLTSRKLARVGGGKMTRFREWRTGRFEVRDYAPGEVMHDYQLEWRSKAGRRRVLVRTGDNTPYLHFDANDVVSLDYQDEDAPPLPREFLQRMTWSDPSLPPTYKIVKHLTPAPEVEQLFRPRPWIAPNEASWKSLQAVWSCARIKCMIIVRRTLAPVESTCLTKVDQDN